MKPEVRCTSVASVVYLFIDVEKKTLPISHFHDRVEQQLTWLLTFTASEQNLAFTRGGPTLTTDQIQSLLLRAHGCNKAQVHP